MCLAVTVTLEFRIRRFVTDGTSMHLFWTTALTLRWVVWYPSRFKVNRPKQRKDYCENTITASFQVIPSSCLISLSLFLLKPDFSDTSWRNCICCRRSHRLPSTSFWLLQKRWILHRRDPERPEDQQGKDLHSGRKRNRKRPTSAWMRFRIIEQSNATSSGLKLWRERLPRRSDWSPLVTCTR